MAEISDVGYNVLSATSDNFIRLETLKAANDCMSNAIAEFPIRRHYDIAETVIQVAKLTFSVTFVESCFREW